tara:strand:- start:292 stop:456 length:165 start_codon:yes stop_codon:yes gene_type:complete
MSLVPIIASHKHLGSATRKRKYFSKGLFRCKTINYSKCISIFCGFYYVTGIAKK